MTCPGCGSDEYEVSQENKSNPEKTVVLARASTTFIQPHPH